MKKIAVFTGSRAEYGLLYWLMKDIQLDPGLRLQLLAAGMHFSPEHGLTYQEIEKDGFFIDEKVEMLLASDSPVGVVKSVGLGIIGFADAIERLKPDYLIVLGDRFEALAVAQAAMLLRVPVVHLHGGEITEGAYDDQIRHAITKLSYLHGVSMDEYRQRVIQLGESPERVVTVGALGLDHLYRTELMSRDELSESLQFDLRSAFFLLTYHPVTLSHEDPVYTFESIRSALSMFPSYKVLITYPNVDDGGRRIIPLIKRFAEEEPTKVISIPSLGQKRYLSALKYCSAVVGNSSSGIIEAPSFNRPTVNIGDRQKGRVAAKSVIHCLTDKESIYQGIVRALDPVFMEEISSVENPYGNGLASAKVIQMIKSGRVNATKPFYDLRIS